VHKYSTLQHHSDIYPTLSDLYLNQSFYRFHLFNYKVKQTLYLKSSQNFLTYNNQSTWEEEISYLKFFFRRVSTMRSFFVSQRVDIPRCLQKSTSLYNLTFETPVKKFSNFIMNSGKHFSTWKAVSSVFKLLFYYPLRVSSSNFLQGLVPTHTILDNLLIQSDLGFFKPNLGSSELKQLNKNCLLKLHHFHLKSVLNPLRVLFQKLRQSPPIFSFYIRRVDKNIRKNTRGKSGKYLIIWKYVPEYKRIYISLRWFLKDLKFQKMKGFKSKLQNLFTNLFISPEQSFLIRLRKFVHNFVFYNFKKSLVQNLRSTS